MVTTTPSRRLRSDRPADRVAVVLSGGGAWGAYEVGVLRVLESIGLVPGLVAGVSVGALNAVLWVAHGGRTAALERTWRSLRGADVGLRWLSLSLRLLGVVLASLAVLEVVLTLSGSRELSGSYWFWRQSSARLDFASTRLDVMSWIVLGVIGALVATFARPLEQALSRQEGSGDPDRPRRLLGRFAIGLALVHALVWVMGWPWPHRFSASLTLFTTLAWLLSAPGRGGRSLRHLALGLMPETGGRGLWTGRARRRLVERIVRDGDAARLVGGPIRLVIGALAVDSGRVCHFINWPDPSPEFVRRVDHELGEVVPMRDADEVLTAAAASSAIPGVFEPVRIDGREFVDAGGFSNQPIHVAIAHGAEAVLVVLLAPSHQPPTAAAPRDVVSLGGRLLELANWRDLQTELRSLPEGWSRTGDPARVCVVEPARPLPGRILDFDPGTSGRLIELGEQDAWIALERAGWLEPA